MSYYIYILYYVSIIRIFIFFFILFKILFKNSHAISLFFIFVLFQTIESSFFIICIIFVLCMIDYSIYECNIEYFYMYIYN